MTGPIEVPEADGGLIVHAKPGGTIVLAFSGDVAPEQAREVVDQIAAGSPDARVIALADVAAVRSWHPEDAPRELAAAMAETRKVRELLAEVLDAFGPTGSARVVRQQQRVAQWRKRAGLPS